MNLAKIFKGLFPDGKRLQRDQLTSLMAQPGWSAAQAEMQENLVKLYERYDHCKTEEEYKAISSLIEIAKWFYNLDTPTSLYKAEKYRANPEVSSPS